MTKENPPPLRKTFERWEAHRPNNSHVNSELAEIIKSDCETIYRRLRAAGSGVHVTVQMCVRKGKLLPEDQADPSDWHILMDLKEPYKLRLSAINISREINIHGYTSREIKNFRFLMNQTGPITSYFYNGVNRPMTTQDYIDLRHITSLVKRRTPAQN
ncbi:MAG: hypothetical protein ACM3IJ_00550 [Candidatus Levyibacteriota bacterium]